MIRIIQALPWVFLSIFTWIYSGEFLRGFEATDNWYEVRAVTVMDAVEGDTVQVTVQRSIRRPFTAEWVVTVRKLTAEGLRSTCTGHGRSQYLEELVQLTTVTLEWWMGRDHPCVLKPGRYVVDSIWTLDLPSFNRPREVAVRSNVFTVSPRT
jgi:hypothetical protein